MKHIVGREKKLNTQKASEINSYQVTPKHFTKKKKKQTVILILTKKRSMA